MAAALRILIVEDHPALGLFIAATLKTGGWMVVGPVTDFEAAMDSARRLPLDLALMDRLLRGKETLPVADVLAERGIPCVLIRGYPRSTLPARFRDYPFLEKPFTID
jgi:DNA-binding response OmpR family regulator